MPAFKVAIKQLTASDLSFFAQHLKRSKQKAINLNSDVFVDVFYPGLKGTSAKFLFRLSIVGPGGRGPYDLTRMAWRTTGSKNWRLDGELVHDPTDEPGRFDKLQEGDFGIIAFEGSAHPELATLTLVSASEDPNLHSAIEEKLSFTGKQSMIAVSRGDLLEILNATRSVYADHHPLEALLAPDSVEEAVYGAAETQERIAGTDGRGAAVSQEVLQRQLRAAEEIGQLGEEAFNEWLEATGHEEDDYEWVSRTHARATHDFHVRSPKWSGASGEIFIDVKSTRGALETPVHMSMAEVRWAAARPNYRIARVHGLGGSEPKLSMLSGVHEIAKQIMDSAVQALPAGVAIDGFELAVGSFPVEFSADIQLSGD